MRQQNYPSLQSEQTNGLNLGQVGYTSSNPLSFNYSDSFQQQKAYSVQSNSSNENEFPQRQETRNNQQQMNFSNGTQPLGFSSHSDFSQWPQSPQLNGLKQMSDRGVLRERQNFTNYDSQENGVERQAVPFQVQTNHKSHFEHTFHSNQNFLSCSSGIVEFQASRGTSLPPKTISQDDHFQNSQSKCTAYINPQLIDSFEEFEVTKSQIIQHQTNFSNSQLIQFQGNQASPPRSAFNHPLSQASSSTYLRMRQSSDSQVRQQESESERKSLFERRRSPQAERIEELLLQNQPRVISNQSSSSDSSSSHVWHQPQQSQVTFQQSHQNQFRPHCSSLIPNSHLQSEERVSVYSQQSSYAQRDSNVLVERVVQPACHLKVNLTNSEVSDSQDSRKQADRNLLIEIIENDQSSRSSIASEQAQVESKERKERQPTQSHHSSMTQSSIPPHERTVNLAQELKEINASILNSNRELQRNSKDKTNLKEQATGNLEEMVMQRTDWLQFLKLVYAQLNNLENQSSRVSQSQPPIDFEMNSKRSVATMVNRDNLVKLIEFNKHKIPLKPLRLQSHPKDHYFSYSQVLAILYSIRVRGMLPTQTHPSQASTEVAMIHWLDIKEQIEYKATHLSSNKNPLSQVQRQNYVKEEASICSGGMEDQFNQSSAVIRLDLVKISENNTVENSINDSLAQVFAQEEKKQNYLDNSVLSKVVKIQLKDLSILLDLSQIQDLMAKSNFTVGKLIGQSLQTDKLSKVRALSLLQFSFSSFQKLEELNALQGLVILNLANSSLKQFSLERVRLPSLQFLNIANNDLSEIHLSREGFPSLKELLGSQNNFRTAKYFSKLDSLKLLDLGENLIDLYEEVICLAFLENLVILNLTTNPICFLSQGQHCPEFRETLAKLLPRVKVLNPPQPVSRVSCFENFKELAFSTGQRPTKDKSQSNYSSELQMLSQAQSQNSCSKQSLAQSSQHQSENTSYVYSKQVNLDHLLSGNSRIVPAPLQEQSKSRENVCASRSEVDELSIKGSPIKVLFDQNMKASKRTEVIQSNSPISYQQIRAHSPCLTENLVAKRSPPKNLIIPDSVPIPTEAPYQNYVKVQNVESKQGRSLVPQISDSNQMALAVQISDSQEGNTFDSNKHTRLEDAQHIPVKNDHLKYFNNYSKDPSDSQPASERPSFNANSKAPNENQSKQQIVVMDQKLSQKRNHRNATQDYSELNRSKEEVQQKPPRYIRIKPTPASSMGGAVGGGDNSFADSSNPFSPRTSEPQTQEKTTAKLYQPSTNNSLVQQSGGGSLAIGSSSLNDKSLLSQVAELHQNLMQQNRRSYHQAIRRDMSVKLSSSTAKTAYPVNYEIANLISQPRIRREQSAYSVSPVLNQKLNSYTQSNNTPAHPLQMFSGEKHRHRTELLLSQQQSDEQSNGYGWQASSGRAKDFFEQQDGDESQSDMAQYYENQKQLMNVKRIREMPSKELCKIQSLSQSRGPRNREEGDSSLSPMKAMMITKPPEDEEIQRSASQSSNLPRNRRMVSSSNNNSLAMNGSSAKRMQSAKAAHQRAESRDTSNAKSPHRVAGGQDSLVRRQEGNSQQKAAGERQTRERKEMNRSSTFKQTLTPQVRGRQTRGNQRSNSQSRLSNPRLQDQAVQSQKDKYPYKRETRNNLSLVATGRYQNFNAEDQNQDLEYSNVTNTTVVTNRISDRVYNQARASMKNDEANADICSGQEIQEMDNEPKNDYCFGNYEGLAQSRRAELQNQHKSQIILKNAAHHRIHFSKGQRPGNNMRMQAGQMNVSLQEAKARKQGGKHQQIMEQLDNFNPTPRNQQSDVTQMTQDVRPFSIPTEDDSTTSCKKQYFQIRTRSEMPSQTQKPQKQGRSNQELHQPSPVQQRQAQNLINSDFDRELSQIRRREHRRNKNNQSLKKASEAANTQNINQTQLQQQQHFVCEEYGESAPIEQTHTSEFPGHFQRALSQERRENQMSYNSGGVDSNFCKGKTNGHNTPRFSQRMNLQKELRYQGAVEIINCRRKKKEQKKQLYNSLIGKSSQNSQSRIANNRSFSNNNQRQNLSLNARSNNERRSSPNALLGNQSALLAQSQKLMGGYQNQEAQRIAQSLNATASKQAMADSSILNYSHHSNADPAAQFISNDRSVVNIKVSSASQEGRLSNQRPTHYSQGQDQLNQRNQGIQQHQERAFLQPNSVYNRNGYSISQGHSGYVPFNIQSQPVSGCAKLSIDLRQKKR